MAEKTAKPNSAYAGILATIKDLQAKHDSLVEKNAAMKAKINALETKLTTVRSRRDELEKIQNQAHEMLLEGSLSDDEFTDNKARLAELYKDIDDTESLLEVYQDGLLSFDSSNSELSSKINKQKDLLLREHAEELAKSIISGVDVEQFKRLAAMIEHTKSHLFGTTSAQLLGDALGIHIFGDVNGEPGQLTLAERNDLISRVLNDLGV